MFSSKRIRANSTYSSERGRADSYSVVRASALCLLGLLFFVTASLNAQVIFQISSATSSITGLASIPAGVNGVSLTLAGTLPTAAQQASPGYLGCFYTGYGSTTGIALSPPNADGTEPLTVPASTIQSIPQTSFTAANGYSLSALVYFVATGTACDGNSANAVSNQLSVQVVAPSLGVYSGPVSVPQTNSAIGLQAAPLAVTLPAGGFLSSAASGGTTSVTFGAFGSVNVIGSASAVYVPVPSAFSSSPVGATASLSICNTLTGNDTPVCTTPKPAITLTVTALVPSSAGISAAPNPVQTNGQTVLTAQFSKSSSATAGTHPGAPSGPVAFVADGTTLAPAMLILDTTATFAVQTTSISTTQAPTPVISPAAGAYLGAQNISITDTAANAAIYYTQDGSAPTNGSTLYTGPFSISTSQTVRAIAAVPGDSNSAVASSAYTITIRPATQLAYQVQAANTALNTAISPAIQVAVEDATGAVVTSSTAAVSVGLYSDPNNGVLSGTLTVNAVNGIATFSDLKIDTLGNGYTIRAYSGNLTAVIGNAFNVTPPAITMTVQSELVGIGATLNGAFTLGAPAPTGGSVVTLSSGTPANVTIAPASVTVPAGQTAGVFTYSGVAAGDSTLSATATSYQTGTVLTTATAAQVSLGTIPNVAPAQMQSLALSLATAAPAGGTTVTFTIANTNIATVTQSVFIPAGQQTPAANPQVTGVLIGTTTVTANAPGYAPATRPVNVTVTATVNPGTTYLNLTTSTNTVLQISAPAPPGGIVFTLTSDDPTIATVPASVTLVKGATSANLTITGKKDGTTTIRATSPGVAEADGTVNVTGQIANNTYTVGYDIEQQAGFYLPVSPSNPTTVTVTTNDPTVAVISKSNTIVGQTTLTYPNTTSSYIGTIWVQGLKVGTTTLTISAPGYENGTETITVDPTGFVYYGVPDFSTTTYSTPSTPTIYPVPLNANGAVYNFGWYINPGSANISVPITSGTTATGTVTSPVVFHPNDTQNTFSFQPVAAGTSVLTIGTPPAGFTVPSQYQAITATVTTPALSLYSQTTAVHLINSIGLGLPVAPPTGQPVTVTLTSSDPTIFTVSNSGTVVGTTSITFPNISNTGVGTVYVQGQKVGSATLTMSAPGYTSATSTITVIPSGFFLGYPFTNFSTTTFSDPTGLNIYTTGLDPQTLGLSYTYLQVSPGVAPFTVGLTNSTPATGTLSAATVTFNPGDNHQSLNFQPVAAGTSTITLVTPTGFTTGSQYQSNVATVTAPAITVGSQETGVNLQNQIYISLPVAPPAGHPVTVTVTSSNAAIAKFSSSATTVGTSTVTFTNVTSTSVGYLYIQGQGVGTSTITESAPGYTSGTNTITVDPSGFTYYYSRPPFTTTTFSSANQIPVYTTSIENGNVYNLGLGLSPGVAPVTVVVTDSAPSVGTISSAALVYNPGDGTQTFNFQPVSAGTATIAISTPAGYSTGQYTTGDITVTAPVITISNVTTGVNLDYAINVYLPQTPPNPVTVTVTSSGPLIGTISKDPAVVGTSSVTFTNVTSQGVGTIYVQGQGLGTAQLTETAPGYINGSSTLTVDPSGFVAYGTPNLTTSVGNDYNITVYASVLNPGTLTVEQFNIGLNPGLGNISVPVTSSDTSVGTFTVSPIVFGPGVGAVNADFHPVATGTSTINIGNPTPATGFSTPSQYTTGTATVQ